MSSSPDSSDRDAHVAAMTCQEEPMSDLPECWINGARFAGDFVRSHMTGAQIRALPVPSIKDDQDLYAEQAGGEDLLVQHDEVVPTVGRRFFSVPKVINAGSSAASTQELRDALAELVVSVRYREPRTDWLAWRSQAIETARGLLTEAELERAEKMFVRAADFEDLSRV